MLIVELLYAGLFISLIVLTTISDIKNGLIYNKTLKCFAIITVVIDFIYYGIFARDIVDEFLLNLVSVVIISLVLFYTKSFAGGDCKLLIVMGMMYPASYYLTYKNSRITLFLAICLSIVYGYIFLVGVSIYNVISRKNKMTLAYVKNYIRSFAKSFITAMIYIMAIEAIGVVLQSKGVEFNGWGISIICVITSWLVNRIKFLRKWYIIGSVILFNIIVSICFRVIMISINPSNYIMVMVLLLCQMTVKNNIYKNVAVEELRPGMILSSFSSAMMQNSRVRGLPPISVEDLRNRLSEDEVNSIKRWAKGRKISSVIIVKKIPFAIFIGLGFISYFVFWSLLI